MAYADTPASSGRVVKNTSSDDGISRNRWTGDNSSTWVRGQLLGAAAGTATIAKISSSGGSGITGYLDTDDLIPSGNKLAGVFIALEPEAAATAEKVAVQKISTDMTLEAFLIQTSTDSLPTAPESIIGNKYAIYQFATGEWAVDKDNTTKPVVEVVGVESQENPWTDDLNDVDQVSHSGTNVRYPRVYVKFLSTVV